MLSLLLTYRTIEAYTVLSNCPQIHEQIGAEI